MLTIHSIWDNPNYGDRYTVYFDGPDTIERDGSRHLLAMSAYLFHPQGIGMHGSGYPDGEIEHGGVEIEFKDLPVDCQKLVNLELDSENA